MDPFWAGALSNAITAFMSLAGLAINRRFKKRSVYLTCCFISIFGTTTLATYFYLDREKYLENNYSWTGWFPIISVNFIRASVALGIGSINHMLQVITS